MGAAKEHTYHVKTVVGISRPRLGCYSSSEFVVGVSMIVRQGAFRRLPFRSVNIPVHVQLFVNADAHPCDHSVL